MLSRPAFIDVGEKCKFSARILHKKCSPIFTSPQLREPHALLVIAEQSSFTQPMASTVIVYCVTSCFAYIVCLVYYTKCAHCVHTLCFFILSGVHFVSSVYYLTVVPCNAHVTVMNSSVTVVNSSVTAVNSSITVVNSSVTDLIKCPVLVSYFKCVIDLHIVEH